MKASPNDFNIVRPVAIEARLVVETWRRGGAARGGGGRRVTASRRGGRLSPLDRRVRRLDSAASSRRSDLGALRGLQSTPQTAGGLAVTVAATLLRRNGARAVVALTLLLALLCGSLPEFPHRTAASASALNSAPAAPAAPWLAYADDAQLARLEAGGSLRAEKAPAPSPKPQAALAAAAAKRPHWPNVPAAPSAVLQTPSTAPAAHRRPSPTGPPALA
jgi:hypothetical protein